MAVFALALLAGTGIAGAQTSSSTATTTATTTGSTVATTTTATTTATTTTVVATSTASSTTATELTALFAQLSALREKIIAILVQDLSTVQTKREKVLLLQQMLAADESVYPEGAVTGYFGNLTKQAVMRFVSKKGLNVSTSTTQALRGPAYLLQNGAGNSGQVPPGLLKAPGIAKKLGIEASSTASSTASSSEGIGNKIKSLFRGKDKK